MEIRRHNVFFSHEHVQKVKTSNNSGTNTNVILLYLSKPFLHRRYC